LSERVDGRAQVEAGVDHLRDDLARLRKMPGSCQGVLELGGRLPERPSSDGFRAGPPAVAQRLAPPFRAQRMMGELLHLLLEAIAVETLDLADDSPVNGAPAVGEQTTVGHLLRERMLEGVFRIGKEAGLV